MKPIHHYITYGLHIASELEFPELLPCQPGEPDVVIRYGNVPDGLPDIKDRGVCYQIAPNRFLLHIENIAKYLVQDGAEILIERLPQADDQSFRLFLLGSVTGALLFQRGLLPLHGSAIQVGDGCAAFLGPSGYGKSTLAAAFAKRGYHILTDDICAISVTTDGRPVVLPGYPQLKLWADVLRKLSCQPESLRRVRPQLEKYAFPSQDIFCAESLPLRRVFIITNSTNDPNITLLPLQGMEQLDELLKHTYRTNFVKGFGAQMSHFTQCAAVAKHTAIIRIIRPSRPWLLEQLVDRLEEEFLNSSVVFRSS